MPKPGLRLSEPERKDLATHYQDGRFHKALDICLWIQALVLFSRGNKERDVAEVVGVGRRTLQDRIHRYRVKGIPGLAKRPFKVAKPRLTDEQKDELSRIIAAGPQEAGLETGVWTTPIIVELIRDLFDVSYPTFSSSYDEFGVIFLRCCLLFFPLPGGLVKMSGVSSSRASHWIWIEERGFAILLPRWEVRTNTPMNLVVIMKDVGRDV